MILKLGSSGYEVKKAQAQLIKLGWLQGSVDGMFGPITQSAVFAFQKANNLVVDGKIGAITYNALFKGVVPIQPPPSDGTLPRIPRSRAEISEIFGKNVIGGSSSWESQNLKFCEIPDAFTCFGKKNGVRGFTCHRLLVPVFQSVFKEIAARGLESKIYSFDGCYNPRKITGGTAMSFHGWAIALDINYEGNTYGDATPAMDREVVKIFKAHNYRWGGDYSGNKDGMHFEYFKA